MKPLALFSVFIMLFVNHSSAIRLVPVPDIDARSPSLQERAPQATPGSTLKGVVSGVAQVTSQNKPSGSTMKGIVDGIIKATSQDTPSGSSGSPNPSMNKATTGLASAKKIDSSKPAPAPQVATSDKAANLAGPVAKPAADKPVNLASASKVGSNSPVRVAADSKTGGSVKPPADKPVSPVSSSTKEGSSASGPVQVASSGKAGTPGNTVAKPSSDRPVSPGSTSSLKDGYESALAKPSADKPVSLESSASKSGSPGSVTAATDGKSIGGKPAADKPVAPISSTTKEGDVSGPIQVASDNNKGGSTKPTMDKPVSPSSSKAGQSGLTQVASSNKSSGGGTTTKPAADKPVAPFESSLKGSGSSNAPVRVAASDRPSASGGLGDGIGLDKGMTSRPTTKLGQDGIPTTAKTKVETPQSFSEAYKEALEASKKKEKETSVSQKAKELAAAGKSKETETSVSQKAKELAAAGKEKGKEGSISEKAKELANGGKPKTFIQEGAEASKSKTSPESHPAVKQPSSSTSSSQSKDAANAKNFGSNHPSSASSATDPDDDSNDAPTKSKPRPVESTNKEKANSKTSKSDPEPADSAPPSSKTKSEGNPAVKEPSQKGSSNDASAKGKSPTTDPTSKGKTPSSAACIPGSDATVGRVLAADGSQASANTSDASILLNKYGPVIIGLLAGNLALMLVMSGLGFYVFVSRGGRARKVSTTRTTSNYHPVKLDDSKDSQFVYAARYDA
ncbi:hypothetical protein AB1N83_007887 [Pleurotus pulmonarius]